MLLPSLRPQVPRSLRHARRWSRIVVSMATVLNLAAGLSSPFAHAQETPIKSLKPNVIKDAVSVYITQKGEGYFGENLESILASRGISIRETFIPEVHWTAEKPIPLDELAKQSPENFALIQTMREALAEWFFGLDIQNPQPDVLFKNGGYRLSFKRLSVATDREALKRLGRTSGVVLALEAEVDKLMFGGESVKVTDIQNQFIGTVGILSPILTLAPGSKALRLRVPVFVDVTPTGVVVESLGAETNFIETDLQFTYGQLLIPDIFLEINGRKFPINKDRIKRSFDELKPRLVEQIKAMADKLARENLAASVNDAIKKSLPTQIEDINFLTPPGAPANSNDPGFVWGLTINKLGLGTQVVGIGLNGFVEDPRNAGVALDPSLGARGPVSLAGSDPTKYDLALVINRGMINRILQLSGKRGYFNEIETKPGEKLKMISAPQIDVDPATAGKDVMEPVVRIRIGLASPVTGLKRTLINGEVKFYVDAVARLVQLPGEKTMRVRLDTIDGQSLDVVEDSLTMLGRTLFKSAVEDGIRSELKTATADWAKNPQILPGELPLPPELLGQTFKVVSQRMDKNGYLVMFLNFAKKD